MNINYLVKQITAFRLEIVIFKILENMFLLFIKYLLNLTIIK